MITKKMLIAAGFIAFAAHADAGEAVITPSLAACSKALIQTLAKADVTPTYTVKSPGMFASDLVDPNNYTVLAKDRKTNRLVAKASCRATPKGEILSFKSLPVKS